jgi:hypothetical protein
VRIEQGLLDRLERIGAASRKSVGQMVKKAIEEFLAFSE